MASILVTPPIVGAEWSVRDLQGKPIGAGAPVTVRFGEQGVANGRAGCNSWTASYQVSEDQLVIGPQITTTRMACPAPIMAEERAFLALLPRVNRWAVATDGGVLLYAGGRPAARLLRADLPVASAAPLDSPETPATLRLRCGAEEMRVEFGAEQANVEASGGSRTTLKRLALPGLPPGSALYSDGALKLHRTWAGDQAGVRYAREQSTLQLCAELPG